MSAAKLKLVEEFNAEMLLLHLQLLIDQRGRHGSTSTISLQYEENGPRVQLYHGESGWGEYCRAEGTTVREALTASLRAMRKKANRKPRRQRDGGGK